MKSLGVARLVLVCGMVLAGVYLGIAFLTSPGKEEAAFDDRPLGDAGQSNVIHNFQHVESQLDKVSWELTATKAELKRPMANLENVKLKFYTETGEVVEMEGATGVVNIESKNIYIRGNVKGVYDRDYRFSSEEIGWNEKGKAIFSQVPIHIVGPDGELWGESFKALPYKKEFYVYKGVTVEFKGSIVNDSLQIKSEDPS